jgi:antitoxin (DNA-binding transcriptional repressor) of toxin-antitoxin stability system
MCDVKRLNVRELHRRTGAVIDQVANGEVVIVEKRGVPLVEMHPAGPIGAGFPPDHWESIKRFPKLKGDSGRFISGDRNRC